MTQKTDSQQQLPVIGIAESIVLPEGSIQAVPAKIDTGADGSSVWASGISEVDGQLSFKLFAPQSAFYTGKVITTDRYRMTRVKNSFGKYEVRYRVWLKADIAGRKYQMSFTLADRSNSNFPILLGRRFLKNRFLVDVSKSYVLTMAPELCGSVVVLTSRIDENVKSFFEQVSKEAGVKIEVCKYRLLSYRIGRDGKPLITLPDGRDIASAQMVYFKAHKLYPEHAKAIARYLRAHSVNFIDPELGGGVARTKLSEMFTLASHGIRVPMSHIESNGLSGLSYDRLKKLYGDVFIIKDPASDRGKYNYLVRDVESYARVAKETEHLRTLIVQKHIENDGFYRVLVMGQEIAQVVFRSSVEHEDPLKSHLNKPAGSINACEIDTEQCSSELISLAQRSALAMQRTVAGVDIVQDRRTKELYVMEVNYNPDMMRGINVKQKQRHMANVFKRKGALL